MGRKKEADRIREQADAQARIAGTQENLAGKFVGYADEDRARQAELYGRVSPVAERLTSDPFAGLARPDLSEAYGRYYADEKAGIQEQQNKSLADVAEYAGGSGAARTGAGGLGLGAIFRGADRARTEARRGYQENLTKERLAGYEDELNRRKLNVDAAVTGADILEGQQRQFDPARTAAIGMGGLSQAVGSRGAATGGYETSARMPGRFSWLGGLAGGALNLAANAVLPGAGLRNIWRGGARQPAMATPPYAG